ncbi:MULTISPECIES: sensor histidine kinase [Clostridium]|uniref:histidine kinase n=1 Tax=Clostridium cadaveris TaxID=1529 RepID=A0A1I2NTE3_9CLOT|nr:HAMP domain-containing sensor histidine kinase [Clostridium cadaveris]MDU4952892.1 HAMP domain-containing sensor histidine kinase [Clostridium sp.]MDY4949428.1 HAMP domain-containing sensor histidine kinase [Clostridium cadaveris]NME65738.1 HAMP domain-containing histidine kinase [Clostridium cadaveris]NWK12236.1 HAMP domain-containing histidine kinase [Clostridium cadaveris]PWL54776.1 MAG: sensor histidine kinase [Clostridium cadaveris]
MEKIKIKKEKEVSIRSKLVRNFMLVIIISIVLLELLTTLFIKQYYYQNIEDLLTNQVKISSDFYNKYFSNATLEENILSNVDVFWNQTDAQVQVMDKNGKLLLDSIGSGNTKTLTEDVKKALNGEKGVWTGRVLYSDSNVMSVSYPLKRYGEIEGVIRFITSLREVDNEIKSITYVFLAIAIFVMIMGVLVSFILAKSIINPIKSVTKVAEKMADGDFTVKSTKLRNDEVGKLSDTLNYMASEIVKKDSLKNEFISNVSHELRTPLTSIKGWAVTLKYDDIDKGMLKDGLDIIENECDRLSSMVEELLSFSKLVSGHMDIKKSWESIEDIVQYIRKHMSLRADRDGIQFNVEIESDIPKLYIDKNRIKQVLINLLDNSFKFTERGGKVNLKVYRDGYKLIIKVQDNGCGIGEDELPHVKEKFFKGKSSKSQNGIGLSICDKLVEVHNGKLDIESELGVGTCITIEFPLLTDE